MASSKVQNALVVEGGAMRGIFSTGILDAFLLKKFNPFDLCIGVSAGASNIASYLAGMYQRNYHIYTDYSLRDDFISWKKFLSGKHLVDLDWLWDISIKERRLDLKKIVNHRSRCFFGATNVVTGITDYIAPDMDNLEELLKASSALPVFYRHFIPIGKNLYADGGVSDPIPVREAYRRGARNILVLRSRPFSKTIDLGGVEVFSKLFLRKYPRLIDAIFARSKVYAESIRFIRNPPRGCVIHEINPPEGFKIKRLTKNKKILEDGYLKGVDAGLAFVEKWKRG